MKKMILMKRPMIEVSVVASKRTLEEIVALLQGTSYGPQFREVSPCSK
ncbi:MAG TPA: hypothetical protein VMV44_14500 [Rectinemataceae bacterium]|nr:hypothetical protein [Rectinemataceae bacterium]